MESGSVTLFTWGYDEHNGGAPLYASGSVGGDPFSSFITLYTSGGTAESIFDSIPLYASGSVGGDPFSSSITLYASGGTTDSIFDSIPLYTSGAAAESIFANIPLFTSGALTDGSISGNVPLFTISAAYASGNLDLYTESEPTSQITLYTAGLDSLTDSATLFGVGHEQISLSGTLSVAGSLLKTGSMPLWCQTDAIPQTFGSIDLFLFATNESGAFGGITLFTWSDASGSILTRSLPMTVLNFEGESHSANLNLWTAGVAHSASSSIWLYAENNQSGDSGSITLYVRGSGISDGYLPAESNLNLFVRRGAGAVVPFYTQGPGTELDSTAPLLTTGSLQTQSTAEFVIPNVVGAGNKTVRLLVRGW